MRTESIIYQSGQRQPGRRLSSGWLAAAMIFLGCTAVAQPSYSFTPAGATGSLGPTQLDVNTAYAATNLNGSVTSNNGIQEFTVPVTGRYRFDVLGASGGDRTGGFQLGGLGASISGEFQMVQGDVIRILVGQKGVDGSNTGSGGGGSFVQRNNILLIAAGAGGGATGDNHAAHGTTLTVGTNDFPGGLITGGAGGLGGHACSNGGSNHGGGGGGYLGDGHASTQSSAAGGGLSFMNGGTGGASAVPGAFGGGGGATAAGATSYGGGGGGGGYSGGAGGQQVNYCLPGIDRSGGGGGASYNSGANQLNLAGVNSGDGMVILTFLCDVEIGASSNPVCEGSAVTLTTNAITTLSWSTGSSTGSSIVVMPSVDTEYHVTGTGVNSCTGTAVVQITMTPLPVISPAVYPQVICVAGEASLTASGGVTYTWSPGGATGGSILIHPQSTTVYTVSGTNALGCTNSETITAQVNTQSLTVSPDATICAGSTAVIVASGAVTYTWNTGAPLSALMVSPGVTTQYTVEGTDGYECPLTGSVTVYVDPSPVVVASADQNLVCRGESVVLTASGADSYVWSNPVTGTGSGASITVNLALDVPYTYTVKGTDANGCSHQTTVEIQVDKCAGVSENGLQQELGRIYPNPTNGRLTVLSSAPSIAQIDILDVTGRVVMTQLTEQNTTALDVSSLPAGIYQVRLTAGDAFQVLKLIKH